MSQAAARIGGWGTCPQSLVPGDMQELGTTGEIRGLLDHLNTDKYCTGVQVAPDFAFIPVQWKLHRTAPAGVCTHLVVS